MKKLLAILMAATLAVSVLAGCGASSSSAAASTQTTPASSAAATTTTGDGTLKLVLSTTDGSSKDDQVPSPWLNRTLATNLMFRSLFIADSDLTSVTPDLADSYEISDDSMTYTITLKDGLKWSDGEAMTADDVIFSIETATKAAVVNSIYTAAFAKITDMKADGNVITIKLNTPYAALLDVLAQFAILPKHSLEKADPLTMESDAFWKDPVTSGMYVLDELNVGNYFTLKLNENYEGTAPKIEKVTVSFVSDYLTAAQSGNADYVYGNAADMVEALSAMDNFTANEVNVLFYKYFIFNMKGTDGNDNAAMQNVEVRKALIEAIDRAALATLYPNATVLSSGVPDSYPSYNGFSYEFDAEKAKADLIAAGYDMSRTLRICYYNNDQTSIDLINTVVYYLEQTGLTVEATLSNDGTTDLFTTRAYDIGFKGKSAFSLEEWYSEYISDDALFSKIFGGDTSFDTLVDDLYAATDEATRTDVLKKLQDMEQKNVYKVPVFTVGTYVFTSDNVKVPSGVKFCNPLYMCDLDFANWEVA
ncbi:MAG: ABC transporter substrate-binding protein [Clostridia bacterium]|nr:ABC transporter substrate-binding protein [Clostridia bacterium]